MSYQNLSDAKKNFNKDLKDGDVKVFEPKVDPSQVVEPDAHLQDALSYFKAAEFSMEQAEKSVVVDFIRKHYEKARDTLHIYLELAEADTAMAKSAHRMLRMAEDWLAGPHYDPVDLDPHDSELDARRLFDSGMDSFRRANVAVDEEHRNKHFEHARLFLHAFIDAATSSMSDTVKTARIKLGEIDGVLGDRPSIMTKMRNAISGAAHRVADAFHSTD